MGLNQYISPLSPISDALASEAIPTGCIRTDVGVIPKDWAVQSLQQCLQSHASYGINAPAVPFDDSLPTYLRITDINEDNQFEPSPRVSVNSPHAQSHFLNDGDLVLARTGASVGKSYLYSLEDGPLVFAGFLIRVTPDPKKLHPAFLSYCVQTRRYWDWISTMSIRSGQPGINGQEYGTFCLPLPTVAEQRAIVEVLSDVDALLRFLERLIAKKRDIKQAAMQQLLTGETRLPAFSGSWETKRFGEISAIRDQRAQPSDVDPNTICIELDHIGQADGRLQAWSTAQNSSSAKYRFFAGDVLFGRLRPYLRKFWLADRNGICTTEIWPLMGRPGKINSGFLHTIVQSYGFTSLASVSYGTHMPRADWNVIQTLEVHLPSIPEQSAIATVLSDMDAEIMVLEERREKTRAIKQGMMQQLLTGRVRLVDSRSFWNHVTTPTSEDREKCEINDDDAKV